MRLVIKYTKEERVKYISHLDLLRTIQRALRRAEIPVAFSKGFNPHPRLAFASALPVGVTSEGEYMDIILEIPMDPEKLCHKLNKALPAGIGVLKAVEIDERTPSLTSAIERASYRISILGKGLELQNKLEDFMVQSEIIVEKPGGKSQTRVNIRDMIHELKIINQGEDGIVIKAILSSGSKMNLKPELLVDSVFNFTGLEKEELNVKIHRENLFIHRSDSWVTPLELKNGGDPLEKKDYN